MLSHQWNLSSRRRRRPILPQLARVPPQTIIPQQVVASSVSTESESELVTMRSTRSKTGTLPAKIVPYGAPILEDEVVDAAIDKHEEAGHDTVEEVKIKEEVDGGMRAEDVVTVFKTCKHKHIENGLYMLRSLGRGKYELVNVQHAPRELLGSVEFGAILKNRPNRLKLMESVKKNFKGIEENIFQAVDSANGNIFRFLNLSLELRFMIYDLTIKSDLVLKYAYGQNQMQGLSLRAVNKQIHAETASFFWTNKFDFSYAPNPMNDNMVRTFDLASANLTEVTFVWMAEKKKNKLAIEMLQKCPNLKVFNLILTKFSITEPSVHHWYPQLVWAGTSEDGDLDQIPKFSRTKGIQFISRLRGLQKVNVKKLEGPFYHSQQIDAGKITQAEIDAFENFLNEKMTQPVIPVAPVRQRETRKTRNSKGKRKSKGYRDADEEDSDYEGASSKRRAKKS